MQKAHVKTKSADITCLLSKQCSRTYYASYAYAINKVTSIELERAPRRGEKSHSLSAELITWLPVAAAAKAAPNGFSLLRRRFHLIKV